MFQRLFGRERANNAIVDALYSSIVAAARQPTFYSELAVPDTPLGRFEMISIHMFIVLRRLRAAKGVAQDVAQELVDQLFLEVDHSLRELGVGDPSVPKRARKLASMFYGRIATYGNAIDAKDMSALADALARDVRPDLKSWPGATRLAAYVNAAANAVEAQSIGDILAGTVTFPDAGARSHAA